MDLWVPIVRVYVGTLYHPYVPTNLLVVTIQASCVYTAGTAVELPCMLAAAAAAAGGCWLLLLLPAGRCWLLVSITRLILQKINNHTAVDVD